MSRIDYPRASMWLLLSCAEPPVTPPAEPPAAPVAPLYEALYAGESGEEATRLGDRVRILAWLRALSPTPGQLTALHAASRDTRADLAALRLARAEADAAELAAVGPAYRALAAELAAGAAPSPLPAVTLPDLQAARAQVARATLDRAATLAAALSPEQRAPTAQALFFLRRPVSGQVSPTEWDRLVGATWDTSDFGTISRTDPGPEDPASLDLGGLWRVGGEDTLADVRLAAVLAMALAHPGLCGAVEAREGRRAPDDLDETCR